MKSEVLRIDVKIASNSIDQAKFAAQQHYNNNGMGNRVVQSASFMDDGGIAVVYYEIKAEKPQVVESIGPKDGPINKKPARPKSRNSQRK